MRVLVIGSGGRESAIAWKLSQSPIVSEVLVSPGNGAMKALSNKIQIQNLTRAEIISLKPELVVVGPEQWLTEGIVDFLESQGLCVLGPSQAAARLESSKAFCKDVLIQAAIPTARHQVVNDREEGLKALEAWPWAQVVVKVDGLAQGKGVIVCESKAEAAQAIDGFFTGSYLGHSVDKILLEEKIAGPEFSAFALCDGDHFVFLGTAVDHKRLLDGDHGPNTGGMGALSPAPFVSAGEEEWLQAHVFAPALQRMKELGTPFKGFLFAGLMKTERGFYVLEFNARMGDPETQALFPRISEDLLPILVAAAQGDLKNLKVHLKSEYALHLVMAAENYPGVSGVSIRRGDPVKVQGLDKETLFFPAAMAGEDSQWVTHGGRVCGITVLSSTLQEARRKVYTEAPKVQFQGIQYRKDLAARWL